MKFKKLILLWTLAVFSAISLPVMANTAGLNGQTSNYIKPYSQNEFQSQIIQGNTVVLDFYAAWCPTCRKQQQVFKNMANDGALKGITILEVNYDEARQLRKLYGVSRQSTLLAFENGILKRRVQGETNAKKLAEFVRGED